MRLLFVIDNLDTGGAQRQMVSLAAGLHQRGHQIDLFCYAPGDLLAGPLQAAGIRVTVHPKRSRFSPGVVFALRRQMRAGRYDLILSYLPTPNVYTILAARTLPRPPRIVISERSVLGDKVNALEEACHQLYRLADHLVVNAHHQRLAFSRRYPWLHNRISTVYNGVDTNAFCPSEREPADQPFRLLAIGSIAPEKNGLCLTSALAILEREWGLRPSVSWAGQHVIKYAKRASCIHQMESEIAARGLTERWQWLYQRQNVVPLYQEHHALVHPSYVEGLPNVVCEALSCGRPVIVSNVLDHPRLVQDGVSGYLFDPQDPHDLARCIKALHDLPAGERHAMGQNGRRFAESCLSLERLCNDYERLFADLLR